jgi:ABC-type uncharacterized transport system involved in gliding motility auxiliary subunit
VERPEPLTSGSFATEDFDIKKGEVRRNPDKERQGPISLAVAATYSIPSTKDAGSGESPSEPPSGSEGQAANEKDAEMAKNGGEARVVVVGTSLFARNNFVGRGGNLDLFLNMLNWLSSDEDLISIRPKDPENTPLNLSQAGIRRLFWGTIVLLPLLIVGTGIRVWWTRR